MTMCSSTVKSGFTDEFEEYRARASSGGSLYGLLRRQGFIDDHDQRSRSQSLFHDGGGNLLSPDDSLHTQDDEKIAPAGTPKKQVKYGQRRRFSAACVDARDITSKQHIQVSISPPPKTGKSKKKPSSTLHDVLEEFDMHGETEEDEDDEEEEASDDDSPNEGEGYGMRYDRLRPPDHPLMFNSITEEPNMVRRRSFSTTQKGNIKNEGDILTSLAALSISQSASIGSELAALGACRPREGSFTSQCSGGSGGETPFYRILMLGGTGVGKTALSQQFTTSECMNAQNTSFDDVVECVVTVLLDGQEAIMEFTDFPHTGDIDLWQKFEMEAYVVVYSVIDRKSFHIASKILQNIKKSQKCPTGLLLVGNKSDLVRARTITYEEGKSLASSYGCQFVEVSASLSHRVDDLLVDILKQIRRTESKRKKYLAKLRAQRQDSDERGAAGGCLSKSKHTVMGRILRVPHRISKSCENLLTKLEGHT